MHIESIEAEGGYLRPPESGGALVVSLEGSVVQTIPLSERALTIGRLPQNGLVLPHATVSRYHAEVRLESGGTEAIITDVGSSGGTLVGGVKLLPNQPFRLSGGASMQIGPYELTYVAAPQARTTVAAPREWMRSGPLGAIPVEVEDTLLEIPSRPRFPVPLPPEGRSRYLTNLPSLFQDNDFLSRLLLIFEALWEPLEQRQDHIALYFDPRTCPASFLPWLAGWLGLTLDRHWPEERRRHLLSEAMELYRWRGTKYGLMRMIEVCTGLTPTITEDRDQPFVFRVQVRIPPSSGTRRDVIEELIRVHKPAHVGYVLEAS